MVATRKRSCSASETTSTGTPSAAKQRKQDEGGGRQGPATRTTSRCVASSETPGTPSRRTRRFTDSITEAVTSSPRTRKVKQSSSNLDEALLDDCSNSDSSDKMGLSVSQQRKLVVKLWDICTPTTTPPQSPRRGEKDTHSSASGASTPVRRSRRLSGSGVEEVPSQEMLSRKSFTIGRLLAVEDKLKDETASRQSVLPVIEEDAEHKETKDAEKGSPREEHSSEVDGKEPDAAVPPAANEAECDGQESTDVYKDVMPSEPAPVKQQAENETKPVIDEPETGETKTTVDVPKSEKTITLCQRETGETKTQDRPETSKTKVSDKPKTNETRTQDHPKTGEVKTSDKPKTGDITTPGDPETDEGKTRVQEPVAVDEDVKRDTTKDALAGNEEQEESSSEAVSVECNSQGIMGIEDGRNTSVGTDIESSSNMIMETVDQNGTTDSEEPKTETTEVTKSNESQETKTEEAKLIESDNIQENTQATKGRKESSTSDGTRIASNTPLDDNANTKINGVDAVPSVGICDKKGTTKVIPELEKKIDQLRSIPKGRPISGRWWKKEKQRFRSINKDATGKKSWSKKMQMKQWREDVLAKSAAIEAEKQKKKDDLKERQRINKIRREENAKKSEVVQLIKDPRKIKKMKRKQLRYLETRDTTNLKV